MERYKIAAAKRIQEEQQNLKFHHLVHQVKNYDQMIRAHYHKYLSHNDETLAWMMAMDASFLVEFLRIFAEKEGKVFTRISSRMSNLIDISGRKTAHNAIVRDIIMLENQIPLFLLSEVLKFQLSSSDSADEMLLSMLTGFYQQISPFKAVEELPNVEALTKSAHLLAFLYHTIVPKIEGQSDPTEIVAVEEQDGVKEAQENSMEKPHNVKILICEVWKALCKQGKGPVRIIKRILISKPIKVVMKLPWKFISKLPVVKLLKKTIENLILPLAKKEGKAEKENSKVAGKFENPPSVEEINIPSVTELSKAGLQFVPTNAGISSIKFDVKKKIFYLPVVCLDVNSEAVLRNLVAYEACNGAGPLVLTRYTELMNGIIDAGEDAKLLREKGMIVNHLKKDEEVAKLCNGMNKSIRLTKVEFFDKAIADVNKFHNGRFSVKFKKLVNRYAFESWKCLTFLAAILLLCLTTLHAFCDVYSCPRIFHHIHN